jgi:hypothetical protein
VASGPNGFANGVDAFVVEKLEAAGLVMSPPASKYTLIRRATFDLAGLPPTAKEVADFEADSSPEAFAKVVDRLLASPRYGERWGRHWLDVARYADTKGYVFQEERHYAFAYTYRDWVIRAFNEDLPYDRFLTLQIAADHVVPPNDPNLAAMGFLTVGRRFINNIHDITDDRIDVVTRGLMGLTVSCARCHDHKFDPVSQKDYYSLYGVFVSSHEPEELPLLAGHENDSETAKYHEKLKHRLAELDRFIAKKTDDYSLLVSLSFGLPLAIAPVERDVINNIMAFPDRESSRELLGKVDKLNASSEAPPRAMVMLDKAQPVTPRVFIRGNPDRPGDTVPRQFISILAKEKPEPFTKGSGRLELAQAIANPNNPLTARVIANRLWGYHFGRGLVRTPGDFGVKGDPPTHPELLDWLATRLIEGGWSLKKLHRVMMLSAAYQQSSDLREDGHQKDPENRLLWRQHRQRLDFEALRDSLLAASGQLDLKVGGRAENIVAPPYSKRRAVYGYIDRQNLPGVFRTFDFASPDATNPQRFVTTIPQQALFMMNSPFVVEQARALANQSELGEVKSPSEWQVQHLYRDVFARDAQQHEVDAALRFFSNASPTSSENEMLAPEWQYGFGYFDESTRRTQFTPLPYFTGSAWQGGTKLPDATLGWVMLDHDGGHVGDDPRHAAIRRWTARRDGTVAIRGELARPSEQGDGVEARIVLSSAGELLRTIAEPKATLETKLNSISVKAGDTVDFIVSCRGNNHADSFKWMIVISGEGIAADSNTQFAGPLPARPNPLTPWEQYAHVLLQTNEFVFVD